MHLSRFLAAAAMALAALPLLASVSLPREDKQWTRLELDDYVIYSAARDRVTRDVAQRLQLMRDGLAMSTHLNVHPPQKVTVILFPNERAFAPFRDAAMGKKMEHVAALFGGTPDAGFMLINADSDARFDRSVNHELTHCVTRNTAGELPLWFTEGIAEFYSTFQTFGRDKLRIGMPISEHLVWLQNRGLIPLTRLFAINVHSPDYSEKFRAGDFYAESWLLVHYLMLGNPERNKNFGNFITLLAKNEAAPVAVEKAFGISLADLEKELRRYLQSPTMHVADFTPAAKHVYVISDPVPAPRDATLLSLGRFLARSYAQDDAKLFYDAALKANPDNGDVYAAIAELAEKDDDHALRDAAIAKAVALDTHDANAYITAGHALLGGAEPPSPEQIEKSRKMFEKAIALNPRSPYAYAGLGASYFESGDDAKAISAYIHSLALEPRDDIAFNLVALYARNGKRDLAQGIIDRYITPRGNAQLAMDARETLATSDLNRAIDLALKGKTDEAMAIVRAARDSAPNATIQQRASDVESQIARHRQIEEINHAVELANQTRFDEAAAVIDTVLPEITDAELLSKAKTLRTQFEAAAKKKR